MMKWPENHTWPFGSKRSADLNAPKMLLSPFSAVSSIRHLKRATGWDTGLNRLKVWDSCIITPYSVVHRLGVTKNCRRCGAWWVWQSPFQEEKWEYLWLLRSNFLEVWCYHIQTPLNSFWKGVCQISSSGYLIWANPITRQRKIAMPLLATSIKGLSLILKGQVTWLEKRDRC